MTPTPEAQERLRQYLLGQLADGVREQIEKDLLANDEFFEELLAIEDEIIDDYLGERLNTSDRAAFENHFLATPERHEQLKFGRAFDRYLSRQALVARDREPGVSTSSGPWTRRLFSSPLRISVAAILAVGFGLGAWQIFLKQSEVDKGLLALNAAYREQRPIESRISSLNYAPYVTTRGPGTERIDQNELRRAELTLLEELNKNPTPAARHALGNVYLANKEFDKAIEQFAEALKGTPKKAQLYSDLGAAWLETGKINRERQPGKGMEEMGRSLESLTKALELDPNLLEARFNRALCRQNQMLFQQALEDWQEYLKRDSTSPWAVEARRNLKLLEDQKGRPAKTTEQILQDFLRSVEAGNHEAARSVIRQSYTSAGNTITNSILDAYLASRRAGLADEAASKLRALSFVAQLEAQDSGDRFMLDVERFYSLASNEQIAELILAREYMAKGYANFTSSNLNEAIENYDKAKRIFARIGDISEARFADYRMGHSYTLQPNIEKAKAMFEPVIAVCEKRGYKWLLSQCLYAAANLELNQSEYSKALERSNEALRLSEDVHDTNGILKNLIQLADKYQSLNNPPRSLEFLYRALVIIGKHYPEPAQVWGVYIAIAFNLNSLNLCSAALDYQKEALVLALAMDWPMILSRTYEYLGLTYGNLKLFDEAIRNTRLAFETGKAFSNEASGQNMMAHSTLQLADLYREAGDYSAAISAYDESIRLYDQMKFQHYAYAGHKGKLVSYLAQADDASTEIELRTVLSLFENNRSKINEDGNRNTFFDLEQQVYDLAIEFAYSRKQDSRRAFEYSESSRARSLGDMLLQSPQVVTKGDRPDLTFPTVSNSVPLATLQTEMPRDAQIVQYAVLNNRLIIWLVTRTDITARESNTSLEDLDQKIRRYLQTISSVSESGEHLSQQARELYSILIGPIEPFLDKKKLLCVVADKTLHFVPYEALVSPASGRYLVEDYVLTFAPSSRVFLAASKSASERAHMKDESLLSVGDPAFHPAAFPLLPRLPAAKKEAEAIIAFYAAARLLVTDDATGKAVRSEMTKANVLHLALHYVPDEKSSLLSRLVLAKRPGSEPARIASDILPASEIYQMKMPRVRLAILSACQTGIEQNYGGEGPISVARPFIAAGVPLVIASLWRVDSDSTAELMTNFHRYRRRELVSSARALRLAQLDMIAHQDPRYRKPYYWASFVAIGGYTEF